MIHTSYITREERSQAENFSVYHVWNVRDDHLSMMGPGMGNTKQQLCHCHYHIYIMTLTDHDFKSELRLGPFQTMPECHCLKVVLQ